MFSHHFLPFMHLRWGNDVCTKINGTEIISFSTAHLPHHTHEKLSWRRRHFLSHWISGNGSNRNIFVNESCLDFQLGCVKYFVLLKIQTFSFLGFSKKKIYFIEFINSLFLPFFVFFSLSKKRFWWRDRFFFCIIWQISMKQIELFIPSFMTWAFCVIFFVGRSITLICNRLYRAAGCE